jgi:hypothetical protein
MRVEELVRNAWLRTRTTIGVSVNLYDEGQITRMELGLRVEGALNGLADQCFTLGFRIGQSVVDVGEGNGTEMMDLDTDDLEDYDGLQ